MDLIISSSFLSQHFVLSFPSLPLPFLILDFTSQFNPLCLMETWSVLSRHGPGVSLAVCHHDRARGGVEERVRGRGEGEASCLFFLSLPVQFILIM